MINIKNITKKINIPFRYIINESENQISDGIKTKLCRLLSSGDIQDIGFIFDTKNTSHSDNIIKMRFYKSKISSKIKIISNKIDNQAFASFVKAGVDTIGLNWKIAPYIVHNYEQTIVK